MSMIGKTLGHYKIGDQPLGKGGMGEVYRAKDLKLGRDVAIKVLPEEFARDADRVSRFQREAKLLASLNHPSIAAIYGLEESGGIQFLVLELVEGETLADQIKRGPIPVEESLKLALQVAEALEAAHEKGVIHRDLKPANIKITPEGKVKVLDFGLAKAFAGEQADVNSSNSPTLSNAATQQGVILGTAAYMSPEQARGKTVDKRADIWAFGCVLFEMLTGRAAFSDKDVTDILAAVIRAEPEWSSLPANLHWRLRELIGHCLEKELKDRYHDISDVRVDIKRVQADPSGVLIQQVTAAKPRRRFRLGLPWVAAVFILGLIIAGVAVWKLKPPEPKRVMRFTYELPEGQQFTKNPNGNVNLAISPDGSQFVYGTTNGFFLRSIDSFDARPIAGTDKDSVQPFFSPDGQWLGYWSQSERKLKKIAVIGGTPIVLCDTGLSIYSPDWHSDSMILYSDISTGLMRIPASGGTPETLIKGGLANLKDGFPVAARILPDEKTLLFTFTPINGAIAENQIMAQSLETGKRKLLLRGGYASYLPTGHLLHTDSDNAFVIPFDFGKLEATGSPILATIPGGVGSGAISDSGTLVYIPRLKAAESGNTTTSGLTLVWVNRQGKEEPLSARPDQPSYFRISPNGKQVALTVGANPKESIWIWDVARETMTRLTFEEGTSNVSPIWTPDGKRIVYSSSHGNQLISDIYWKASDGTGETEKLASSQDRALVPYSWSKDGKTLAVMDLTLSPLQAGIGTLSMEGDHARKPLLQEKYIELEPRISPDGRWIAYASNESGKFEVYVRPFPDVNKGKWQVSTSGGNSPLWSPDGRELFYYSADSAMAVPVETEPTFKPGKPTVLFRGRYSGSTGLIENTFWDISPDGKRFLMMKEAESTGKPAAEAPRKINIVLNWFEEMKQRVPTK